MHPQLIPEKHPMCGKYMEALVACRKANPFDRFRGACNDITLQLSKCLVEEKQQERAPRQAQFHARWRAKREADAARMAQLEQQAADRAAAVEQSAPGGGPGGGMAAARPQRSEAASGEAASRAGVGAVRAASIMEVHRAAAGLVMGPVAAPASRLLGCQGGAQSQPGSWGGPHLPKETCRGLGALHGAGVDDVPSPALAPGSGVADRDGEPCEARGAGEGRTEGSMGKAQSARKSTTHAGRQGSEVG
ncbi:hypothetical protein V8C86DRAFT_2634501 [Haematococcus lacustris]